MSWTYARLDEVAKSVGGATPSTAVPEYWNGEIQWATPADLSELHSRYISDTPRKITTAGLQSCAADILPANSVLISSRAPIGYVAINLVPMATNQGFKSIVPDASKLCSGFAYWWLKANEGYLQRLGNGATFKEISKAVVSGIQIPVPPLDEQQRIAATLDQADDLRRKRRLALGKLNQLPQAIFHELFGDPIRNHRGWPLRSIADLVSSFATGKNLVAEDALNSRALYRVLRISAIGADGYNAARTKALPHGYVPPAEHRVRPGDLLITRANTRELVGRVALVEHTPDNVYLPDKVLRFVFKATSDVEVRYVQAVFEHRSMRELLDSLATGTSGSMKNLSQGKLLGIKIAVPPMERQRSFSDAYEELSRLTQCQRGYLLKLDRLIESLQHRAFNGTMTILSADPAIASLQPDNLAPV
ncbi:MAG: restriction endonuclease subunit S [Candidatus Eremiobacteraeota bacterium]|nr:restriction endonuclease subunit S [Candidatus Eremiobacteraeota bacterium]